MDIEITKTQIVTDEHGPDVIFLHTSLPNPTFPFSGTAVLTLTCAKGTSKAYLRDNGLGDIPNEIVP
jgi:hypothetical protein